jgi:hypothetical protein
LAKIKLKNNKTKTSILFLTGFMFFSLCRPAFASVIISEFVSHPNSGEKEWVELLNTGDSPVDLSGWKLTELSSPGTNPTENDFLSLSGTIDDILVFEISSSKLNDTGDSIGLYNGENEVDRVTFGSESTVLNYPINLSSPSTGKSGAFVSGLWENNQESTKGEKNAETETISSVEDEESTEGNSSSGSKENIAKVPTQKTKVQIITKRIAYVGIPFSLEGSGTDEYGEKLSHGRYYWNFGDGDFREVKVMNTDKFTHTYFYPGDYSVSLLYFPDSFADTPLATINTTIKVVVPEVFISSVGDEKDFFVELTNKTAHDTDISNWILLSDYKVFKIPQNTIIQANKKIVISPRITNFSITDKNTLRLETSEGDMAFDYSKIQPPKSPLSRGLINSSFPDNEKTEEVATALNSGILEDEKTESLSLVIPFISFLFIGGSAGLVYFIRRKNTALAGPEDFEILDD